MCSPTIQVRARPLHVSKWEPGLLIWFEARLLQGSNIWELARPLQVRVRARIYYYDHPQLMPLVNPVMSISSRPKTDLHSFFPNANLQNSCRFSRHVVHIASPTFGWMIRQSYAPNCISCCINHAAKAKLTKNITRLVLKEQNNLDLTILILVDKKNVEDSMCCTLDNIIFFDGEGICLLTFVHLFLQILKYYQFSSSPLCGGGLPWAQ